MRGAALRSPFSVLFLFAIVFLLFARRGVPLAASILMAGLFALSAMYCLQALREADRLGLTFLTALHPKKWASAARKQLQSAAKMVVVAMFILLGAGLLTGKILLN